MSRPVILLVLFVAAALEAGGDAVVRTALHTSQPIARFAIFGAGAVLLFAYGWVVNSPPWDFGKLLGIYVVFFFVIAQLLSIFAFGAKPTVPILIGGALIIAGGLVIGIANQ